MSSDTRPDGRLYIGGEWRKGRGADLTSIFPADRSTNLVFAGASTEDVDLAIDRAQEAQRAPAWRNLKPHERATYLHRISEGIQKNVDRIST